MTAYVHRSPGFHKWLLKLSMPMILQNLITFSLGLIDTFMVSQLGNEEMAAVTTANVPVFLLISIVFGVQSGLGILVSQYWQGRYSKYQPCNWCLLPDRQWNYSGPCCFVCFMAGTDHGSSQ